MANLSKIVQSILDVATQVAPLIGGPATGAVAALTAIQNLLKTAKGLPSLTPADKAALDAELSSLQARVTARAKALEDSLRGSGPRPPGT